MKWVVMERVVRARERSLLPKEVEVKERDTMTPHLSWSPSPTHTPILMSLQKGGHASAENEVGVKAIEMTGNQIVLRMVGEEAKATDRVGTQIVLMMIAMRAIMTTKSGSLRGKLLKRKSLSIWLRKLKERFTIFIIFIEFYFTILFHSICLLLMQFPTVQAAKVAKKLKAQKVSGYSNDSNPFGDSNLNEKYVFFILS